MQRIAIIGAGLSGLVLANALRGKAEVVVFEKARGVGGRMSTRYAEPFYFDHGTQFFTARLAEFQKFLKPYLEKGIVAEWKGKVVTLQINQKETKRLWFEPHFVASPNMNSLCKSLAEGLSIQTACEIKPLDKKSNQNWMLFDKNDTPLGEFDWVISTAPSVQTAQLFTANITDTNLVHQTNMQGCYALMLGFKRRWDKQWIAAQVNHNPIQWISINSSKPGRNKEYTCMVAHTSNAWAEAHIDDDQQQIKDELLENLIQLTGIDIKSADYIDLHRWRYAIVDKIVDDNEKTNAYADFKLKLAATSDWCETSRIESVWLHANKLADAIMKDL